MHQSLLSLSSFGTAEERVRAALASLSKGGGVCADDENRENEGDLIFSAQNLLPCRRWPCSFVIAAALFACARSTSTCSGLSCP